MGTSFTSICHCSRRPQDQPQVFYNEEIHVITSRRDKMTGGRQTTHTDTEKRQMQLTRGRAPATISVNRQRHGHSVIFLPPTLTLLSNSISWRRCRHADDKALCVTAQIRHELTTTAAHCHSRILLPAGKRLRITAGGRAGSR